MALARTGAPTAGPTRLPTGQPTPAPPTLLPTRALAAVSGANEGAGGSSVAVVVIAVLLAAAVVVGLVVWGARRRQTETARMVTAQPEHLVTNPTFATSATVAAPGRTGSGGVAPVYSSLNADATYGSPTPPADPAASVYASLARDADGDAPHTSTSPGSNADGQGAGARHSGSTSGEHAPETLVYSVPSQIGHGVADAKEAPTYGVLNAAGRSSQQPLPVQAEYSTLSQTTSSPAAATYGVLDSGGRASQRAAPTQSDYASLCRPVGVPTDTQQAPTPRVPAPGNALFSIPMEGSATPVVVEGRAAGASAAQTGSVESNSVA